MSDRLNLALTYQALNLALNGEYPEKSFEKKILLIHPTNDVYDFPKIAIFEQKVKN